MNAALYRRTFFPRFGIIAVGCWSCLFFCPFLIPFPTFCILFFSPLQLHSPAFNLVGGQGLLSYDWRCPPFSTIFLLLLLLLHFLMCPLSSFIEGDGGPIVSLHGFVFFYLSFSLTGLRWAYR